MTVKHGNQEFGVKSDYIAEMVRQASMSNTMKTLHAGFTV